MRYEELYPKYFDRLTRYLNLVSRNWQQAEDAAQEAFMKVWANPIEFGALTDEQQRAWLNTSGRRVLIDRARKAARAPRLETERGETDDLSNVYVSQMLALLPPEERRLVEMRHFARLTSSEIGLALGLPPATVRTRLRAAVQKLRRAYREQEES